MKTLILTAAGLLLGLLALAGDASATFIQRGNLFYRNGIAHTRQRILVPGYWSNGCYVGAQYRFQYNRVTPPRYQAPVTAAQADWKTQLLAIAAARDKAEAKWRGGALEQAYFLQTVKALGLEGNFRWEGYGAGSALPGVPLTPRGAVYPDGAPQMPYALTGEYRYRYGANAGTQYGYSYADVAKLYGSADIATLFQMANQHVLNSQNLAGDGAAAFGALVSEEGKNRAEVAKIMTKGLMAAQIIAALSAPGGTEFKSFKFRVAPGGGVERDEEREGEIPTPVKEKVLALWQADADARCAACHTGKNAAKNGFNIADYPSMSKEKKQAVWERLASADPKQLMPRGKDGLGKKSTPEQLRLWFVN